MRLMPCCMCPALSSDFQNNICESCDFVNTFRDERDWTFFARAGLGENNYKAFYKKPGKNSGGHGYRNLPWKESFREAQEDLNQLALKKGWQVVE